MKMWLLELQHMYIFKLSINASLIFLQYFHLPDLLKQMPGEVLLKHKEAHFHRGRSPTNKANSHHNIKFDMFYENNHRLHISCF